MRGRVYLWEPMMRYPSFVKARRCSFVTISAGTVAAAVAVADEVDVDTAPGRLVGVRGGPSEGP
jgi:hypothetical protein